MTPYFSRYHYFLIREIRLLADQVKVLRAKEPDTYKTHPTAKYLKKIWECLRVCTQDPTKKEYLCTNALPKDLRHWRRIKNNMPDRYRLFFQYSSVEKIVIYVWLNGPENIRRKGHKDDVYKAFAGLVSSEDIPNAFKELLSQSQEYPKKQKTS